MRAFVGDWWADVMSRFGRRAKQVDEGRHGRHLEQCREGLADAARRVVAEQPPFEPVFLPPPFKGPYPGGLWVGDAMLMTSHEYRRFERECEEARR